MKRSEVFDAFERAGVSVSDDLAFHTDESIERLWHLWIERGSPPNAIASIYHDTRGEIAFTVEPCNAQSTGVADVSSLF